MRLSVAAVAICVSVVGLCAAQNVAAAMNRKPTNIPAQPLSTALEALAKERDLQVIYRSDLVQSIQSAGAMGVFTPAEALTKLLTGTGLTFRYLNETTVTITSASAAGASGTAPTQPSGSPPISEGSPKEAAKSLPFLLAQATGQGSSASFVEQQQRTAPAEVPLQEVIVTAQKREERLQDVPVPVTVITGDTLSLNNQPRLQDFYLSVPGLNMSPPAGGSEEQNLAIRGITSGAGASPTVAITLDDVPFGFTTGLLGDIIPDFDPADIARVEVLRGPQGALYGASGLGGLIKYVTLDPSTAGFSGRVQTDLFGIKNGAELGYGIRGSVNVPLSDTFAIRASAFTRRTPGYIDNPVLGSNGINQENVSGGRLAALWSPSDALSLKLSALIQDDKGDGADEVNLPTAGYPQTYGLGDLQQIYLPGIGAYDKKIQAYSAILKARLGDVDLTSVTGYNITNAHSSLDYTYALGSIAESNFGVSGAAFVDQSAIRSFTQELRASIPVGKTIDWLVGAFFTHQVAANNFIVPGVDPTTGEFVGNILSSNYKEGEGLKYQEIAAFTDVTVHFTDKFDVQVGGRESRMTNGSDPTYQGGVLTGPETVISPGYNPESTAFTYLLTPRLKISPDLMTYIRLASGYRPGGGEAAGPDAVCQLYNFPCEYAPDKTDNYEIGVKGDALDHRLSFDASVYYISWKDIQLRAVVPNQVYGYTTNGSAAKSEGIEASVEARPLTGLTISFWAAYNDAVLTQDFPAGSLYYGVSGDRLPFATRFSGNMSVNQDFAVTANAIAFAGLTVTYQGDSLGNFATSPDRQTYPAFTKVDVRAGLKYAKPWMVNLYVSNVTDKRAIIGGGGAYNFPPYGYVVIQPRTVGAVVQYSF